MIFSANNVSDLKRYFQGSYVKFPMSGELVHFVDRVESNMVRGRFYGPNESGAMEEQEFRFHLYSDEYMQANGLVQPDVCYIMPRKSYFNHGSHAYLLRRIPARQYHRGVTSDNTSVLLLDYAGDFDPCSLKFDLLTSYVGKQAFPGFGPISDGSRAVSPRIAYTASGRVFVDMVRIGSINHADKEIVVNSDLFFPELTAIGGDYTVKTPTQERKPSKRVSPKGYVPKKITTVEFNEEVQF